MVDALEYWKHICMRIASELLAAKPELVRGFSTSLFFSLFLSRQ
tara:strand:- start:448 stop:579 length:132 start_codon:yes stop_codon:yes gene_type:complete